MKKIALLVNTSAGTVADWSGQSYDSIPVVHNDSVLFCAIFQEPPSDGTGDMIALDLSGATALRCQVRNSRIAPAASKTDLGLVTAYNQGDWSGEALASGKVSWMFPLTDADFVTLLAGEEYVDVWVEFSWLDASANAQTLAQFQIRVYDELDNGAAGSPPPTTPTYLTATEIASAYVAKALFDANTIIAATVDDTPAAVTIAEQTLVGRITGGNIAALTATQVRTLIGVSPDTLFDANTILKADSDDTPTALTIAEQTLVGRITGGTIAALTATQIRTLLDLASLYAAWDHTHAGLWTEGTGNADVDIGTEVVDTYTTAVTCSVTWLCNVVNAANTAMRTMWVTASLLVGDDGYGTPTYTVSYIEGPGPDDIGTVETAGLFSADYSGGTLRLLATMTTDNWAANGTRLVVLEAS